MTLKQTISRARAILAASNIEDIPLECGLLLRYALGISRVQLYLDLDRELSPGEEETFWRLVRRRQEGEPVAYIIGHREFYGLDFQVDPRVLIPRPETELLVERALDLERSRRISTIAEVGTGCGAIAVSLAVNLPKAKLHAIDISEAALEVARINCQKHGVTDRISLLCGDMLDPLPEPVDLIIANLPYIKESELASVRVPNPEPRLALAGGPDGLEKIRQLCRQAGRKLRPDAHLLLEVGRGQAAVVTTFLRRLFPSAKIGVTADLSSIDRVVNLTL